MSKKICNQVLKEVEPNMITCLACGIKDPLPVPPISMDFYAAILRAFIKLHEERGCNKKKITEDQ